MCKHCRIQNNKRILRSAIKRYRERAVEGLCTRCGAKAVPHRKQCEPCLQHSRLKWADYRQRIPKQVLLRQRLASKKWKKAHPEFKRMNARKNYKKLRLEIFAHYGLQCACCKDRHHEFLTIDHIHGQGNKHLREIRISLYRWLKNNHFPKGFQTLCWNCNEARRIYGICPHQMAARRGVAPRSSG